MKKISILVVLVLLILNVFMAPIANACTSFAAYSDNVVYGKNMDYPSTELRFSIRKSGNIKVFYLDFQNGNEFLNSEAMNSEGLFYCMNMLFPDRTPSAEKEANGFNLGKLNNIALPSFSKVEEVTDYISSRKLEHVPFESTLHSLYADKTGNASVLEVGIEKNEITKVKDKFIVMSNFPNWLYADKPYNQVFGVGDGRYVHAYKKIKENINNFDMNSGFETLKSSVQDSSDGFPTICSTIYMPEKNEVYFSLNREFNKIWKVSIDKNTIETFSGFDKKIKLHLGQSGILASELLLGGKKTPLNLVIGVGVGIIILAVCVLIFLRRKNKVVK